MNHWFSSKHLFHQIFKWSKHLQNFVSSYFFNFFQVSNLINEMNFHFMKWEKSCTEYIVALVQFYLPLKLQFKNIKIWHWIIKTNSKWRSLHDLMVNVLDYNLEVREFKLKLCYSIHFWNNTLGKGMSPLFTQLYVK